MFATVFFGEDRSPCGRRRGVTGASSLGDTSDLLAASCPLRLEHVQHTRRTQTDTPTDRQTDAFSAYLHAVEDARLLKVELDVHAALAQRLAAPAQVVVARPHPQLLGLHEIVSAQDAVAQLTQASELHPACARRCLISSCGSFFLSWDSIYNDAICKFTLVGRKDLGNVPFHNVSYSETLPQVHSVARFLFKNVLMYWQIQDSKLLVQMWLHM